MKTQNATARLAKAICRNEAVQISNVIKPNGDFTESPIEMINCLLDALLPGNQKVADCNEVAGDTRELPMLPSENEILVATICSTERMEAVINEFQPYKALGPDGIYPVLLQKDWSSIKRLYKVLFQACLRYSYVPKA